MSFIAAGKVAGLKKGFMAKNSAAATNKSPSKRGITKRSATKTLHVVPRADGWVIRSEGISRPNSVHSTQREAVEAGRILAKKKEAALVIHGRDGRVKSRDSYSRDPLPPREPRKVLFPTTTPRTASREAIMKAVSEAVSETAGKVLSETKGSNRTATRSKSEGGAKRDSRSEPRH